MRHLGLLPVYVLMLATACARPVDRPLSGAQPPGSNYTPAPIYQAEAPPTLSPPTRLALATQGPASQSSPTPVAGGRPILRSVQPPPNGDVPVGEIRIAAQIVGFSNLAEVTATLNGQPVPAEVAGRDERHWTAFFSRQLDPGEHEVRIVARDDQGRSGGYRWRFNVVATRTPGPASSPAPAHTPAPKPASPTRQP